MKKLLNVLFVIVLALTCIFACVSCSLFGGETPDTGNQGGVNSGDNGAADETPEVVEDSYRIRFVYSYIAKVENASGRLENKQSIVTVKSFFIPKDNTGVSSELVQEMKGITFNGFKFVKWYSEWDVSTQTGVAGTEYEFDGAPITDDITLYCDRGDLAGENISWSLEYIESEPVDDKEPEVSVVLHIDGTGAMFDFQSANEIAVPWYKYADEITKVVVSDGVTSIGNHAFGNLSNVTEVILPDSVERISQAAFEGYGATSFIAPKSLKAIEKNAFVDTSLREVVLNEGLEVLGERAFYGSNRIKTIVFPSTIKEIPVASFHPGTVNGKNNKHYLSKVYYLGDAEDFKSINIGIDNTWFADKATIYYFRENLAEGEFGTYWKYAGENNTPVQYFYTLRYIQGTAKTFLCNIYVPVNPVYDEDGNVLLDEEGLPILKGVITEDHIRQQKAITYHGYQFAGFSGADTLRVGNEITSDLTYTCQRGNILSSDGGIKWAQSGTKLSIYVDPDTESRITADIEGRIKDGKLILTAAEKEILGTTEYEIDITDEIKAQLIAGRLENSLRMWDFEYAFDISSEWTASTTTVEIGEGVKYIGRYAFAGIARTYSMIIPASVEGIHPEAFEGCTDLSYIYYNGVASDAILALSNSRFTVYSKAEAATASIGSYWMDMKDNRVTKRITWTLTADGKLTIGGDENMVNFTAASDAPWYGAKDQITSVAFRENIYSIGENAINGYINVASISLPRNARIIPESALSGTGVVINTDNYQNNLLVINGHLIKVNPIGLNLNIVETYTGIVTIAEGAFSDCTAINALYVSRTIQYIAPGAFGDCTVGQIFVEGDKDFWAVIDAYVDFPGAKVYFKHTEEFVTIVDENGKTVTVPTNTVDDTYWYKSGSEYIIWGCAHIYDATTNECINEGCDAKRPAAE